jgi:hypothetical protein
MFISALYQLTNELLALINLKWKNTAKPSIVLRLFHRGIKGLVQTIELSVYYLRKANQNWRLNTPTSSHSHKFTKIDPTPTITKRMNAHIAAAVHAKISVSP